MQSFFGRRPACRLCAASSCRAGLEVRRPSFLLQTDVYTTQRPAGAQVTARAGDCQTVARTHHTLPPYTHTHTLRHTSLTISQKINLMSGRDDIACTLSPSNWRCERFVLGRGVCRFVCVCVVAWFSVWRSAARQQPLLGSEAMWGLRLPLCRGLACPVTPNELL